MRKALGFLMMLAAVGQYGIAQLSPSAAWAAHAPTEYQVFPNLTYLTEVRHYFGSSRVF